MPYPHGVVRATGILESLGAIGLTVPWVTPLAGIGLVSILVALFPTNIRSHARGSHPAASPRRRYCSAH